MIAAACGPFSHSVWLRQLRLLFVKDWIIAKRNIRSTLLSIFVPILFVAFLIVLKVAFDNNERLSVQIKPVPEGIGYSIGPIPRCFVAGATSKCTTIAFSPSNDVTVQAIMERIRISNNFSLDDVLGFETADDVNRYLLMYPNTTQGAYHFFVQRQAAQVTGVRYAIQLNRTRTTFRSKTFDPSVEVLIPMQKRADIEIVRELANTEINYDFDYVGFAHPQIRPWDVSATYGPTFFFGALMFNFVIQLGRLVLEKELNLRSAMNLMGLRTSAYWTEAFLVTLLYNSVSTLMLSLAGLVFQLKFFLKNDFALYFILFFLFGLSMTPLVLLLSIFVSKARTATVLGFGVFLVGSIVQGFATLVFVESTAWYYRVPVSFLPFALLAKGMSDLSAFSDSSESVGMRWSQRNDGNYWPLTLTYGWLILDGVVFLLLSIYLDQVIPDDNGIRQHPLYFLQPSYWFPSRRAKRSDPAGTDVPLLQDLDDDVAEEMKTASDPSSTMPFRMINLKKTFPGYEYLVKPAPSKDFHAVRGMYLTLEPNKLFCLLGHNGAGKTTTINVLTGLTPLTSGNAWILGKSIRDQMPEIQKSMGVCPQHDILWQQMTAREHLELFAGFKDISKEKIDAEVIERLKDVDLLEEADNVAGNFSGGMKRRLSVAISLTGNPQIVYLDEPTTGMDPVSRRKVWNLIERIKHERITILTTHSMEEADILGDRIGIMHQGRLACLGNSIHLKHKFGSGYRITILTENSKITEVKEFLTSRLEGATVMDVEEGSIKFNVPPECMSKLPVFFADLEAMESELAIFDVQLSLPTLEEVFLKVGGIGVDERFGEQNEETPAKSKTILERIQATPTWLRLMIGLVLVILAIIIIKAASTKSVGPAPELSIFSGDVPLDQLQSDKWNEIRPDTSKSLCARGDPYSFFVKPTSIASKKLIIEFEGGGVCWDAQSCASIFGRDTFNASIGDSVRVPLRYQNHSGIFSSRADNAAKGWTHIYIPLCTADAFLGNATTMYDAGLTIRHLGAANAMAALRWLFSTPIVPTQILVAGWGNGVLGAAAWTKSITSNYPTTSVLLLSDSIFDVSTADLGDALSGFANSSSSLPIIPLVTLALDDWRTMMYSSWNTMSVSIMSDLLTAVNASQLSHYRLLVETSKALQASKLSFAQFSFAKDDATAASISSRLLQSPRAMQMLQQYGINQRTLTSVLAGSSTAAGTGNGGLAQVLCNVVKTVQAKLLTELPAGKSASFIAAGGDPAGAMINLPTFYSATGSASAEQSKPFHVWFSDLLAASPVFSEVTATACT